MGEATTDNLGKVFLVGAGPGDPGLMTLRGVEVLKRADLVLYDYLINPQILEHAPSDARLICLGRHGQGRIMPQEQVNEHMISSARQGATVVRLKGGDPAVFARGAEEIEALSAAGIPFEIVPGITAALAAGSCAGIAITHRHLASAVALITGQEMADKHNSGLDFGALAHFPGTLIFYMGVTTAETWTAELIGAGKPAETPAVIIWRCSLPDQRTIPCTLGTVAQKLAAEKIRPPAIVIIGQVVTSAPAEWWFSSRPLFGRCILLPRPLEQSISVRSQLAELGADVMIQPAILISDPPDWTPVDEALSRLSTYDWLVFSSSNGVRYLMQRLLAEHGDLRLLGGVKLGVIGPGTAEELARYHLKVDLQPQEYRAESLAAALTASAAGKRFLLARASRGRELLADELRAAGAVVDPIVVYTSSDVQQLDAQVTEAMESGQIDWITVTSSAIARSLVFLFGNALRQCRLASISPITSATLRELGFEPSVEAAQYTLPGLIEQIVVAEGNEGNVDKN